MEPKEFFNINTFLSSPIKRKSLSTKHKNDLRATYSQTSKNRAKNISSIFNQTFFVSIKNTKKGGINLKMTPKSKTQQTIIKQQDDEQKNKKTQKKQKPQYQKIIRQKTQPNSNYSFIMGVKKKSLTFECYFKKIKQSQKQEKKDTGPQPSERQQSSLSVSKQYTTDLNYQMLESMKKYIEKGQKVAEVHGKYLGETTPYYGLDIKAMEVKKPQYIDQELLNIKEMKRYSMSSLIAAKKQFKLVKEEKDDCEKTGKNTIKDRRVLLLEKMLCKSKSAKTQNSPSKLQIVAQKSDQKTLISRLQGMTVNLNLILNSFKCIWVKQTSSSNNLCRSPKKQQKYTYFIGYGNNKNLIRSIMRKRWWWSEVYSINEANFVWTQLKVNEILEQIEMNSKERKEVSEKGLIVKDSEQLVENEKGILETLNKGQISLRRKNKPVSNQYLNYLMRKQNLQKLNWIFHQQTPIDRIQAQSNHPSHNQQNFTSISPPKVVHNHFRLNYMFGNKNGLFHNLRGYFEFMKNEEKLYNFIPKTYYLEKENKLGIREFFQKEFAVFSNKDYKSGKDSANGSHKEHKVSKTKNIWIVKPAENSNRGQGISVHSNFESIRKQIICSKNSGKFIVQSYLRNLFLYQKRKFDIRTYLLMVKIGSITKYFWYHEGYIRTSSEYYNTNDIENIFIHLTNDAIQCDSQKYGKFQPGNKLSYSQFQRYLDGNYPKERYQVEALNNKMKAIATEAVRAIHPKIKAHTVEYSFQLFGLDFLIDSKFNPWLLQINTNPCLQLACPVLQRLIPRMLQNMFRLCLDPIFQPHNEVSKTSSYFIYDNLFDINRFQLIFDSSYDENKQYMEWCDGLDQKVYADDNDVFENDGEEVDVNI